MAHDEVNEETVYTCTGQPLPNDIAKIVEWILNEDFSTAYHSKYTTQCTHAWTEAACGTSLLFLLLDITSLKTIKGLALEDIITQIHTYVHRGGSRCRSVRMSVPVPE